MKVTLLMITDQLVRYLMVLSAFGLGIAPMSFAASVDKEKSATSLEAEPLSPAIEQLKARLSRFDSMSGQFTQTLYSKDGKELQATEGVFTFKKPGYYFWESANPYPQTVVGNGDTVWVYDPDLEQVTVTSQATMPYNPANLLSGGIDDLAATYAIKMTQRAKVESFVLVPKDTSKAPFVGLAVTFDGETLTHASLTDRLGQETQLHFSQTKTNIDVSAEFFNFKIPEGTDVLMNE